MGEHRDRGKQTDYSVPQEAQKVFIEQLLLHPLVSRHLPKDVLRVAHKVRFSGSSLPMLPVNWRVAESSAALHGLVAALLGLLIEKKYGMSAPEMEINT